MQITRQYSIKEHPYFAFCEPNHDESFIDWVPSGILINTTDKVSCSPITCFKDFDDLILSLIENDPEMPLSLMPIPFDLFSQFSCCERTALILPPGLPFENGEYVYFISLNENGFPTGEWFEAELDYQDYTGFPSPGLKKGYELVVLDIYRSSSLTV